jgi:hypothetical protein
MSKAAEFVAKAREEVGYFEGPEDNQTKYQSAHQPWCGAFLNWCAKQVGYTQMPNLVYTPAGAEAFKGKGAWSNPATAKPQPGDIVFFDFPGGQAIDHVGVVVKDNLDGTVVTVEGNSTPDKKVGSQSNGGEVCLKVRAYKKDNKRKLPVFIAGFGRPKW